MEVLFALIGLGVIIGISTWVFVAIKSSHKLMLSLSEAGLSEQLVDKLEVIATLKDSLPLNQRGWIPVLGLYVQLRVAAGMKRLEAGGMTESQIDLWKESDEDPWQVGKYMPGSWEQLVDPTLQIAIWICEKGALYKQSAEAFNKAVESFKATGILNLP